MNQRRRLRQWLLGAWSVAVVVVLLANVVWPLPGQEAGRPWAAGLLAFPLAGWLLLARRPGNTIGRILSWVGVAAGAIFTSSWYATTFPDAPFSRHVEALAALAIVGQFGGLTLLLHLFPTGTPRTARHRRLILVFGSSLAGMAIAGLVSPAPLDVSGRSNPFAIDLPWIEPAFTAGAISLPVFTLLGLWTLVQRRKEAGPVERAQLRWFFLGAGLVLVMVLIVAVVPEDVGTDPLVEPLVSVAIVAAFWSLPTATVVAVTRYRLYEVDRLISRTATYTVVAGVIAGVYAVSVLTMLALFPVGGSDLAVAASTVVAAVAFSPVRRRVQRWIDRRFNRSRYEADLVAQEFSRRLRHRVDADSVSVALAEVTIRTLEPTAVGLWLAPRR